MDDYINRTALKKAINDYEESHGTMSSMALWKCINEQPSVDAVEVVRCKDCKWYQSVYGTCSKFSFKNGDNYNEYCAVVEPDGYCKWGEKE